MKKVNLNEVTELINNQVSNSLKEVKASKTQKPKETKESKAKKEPKAKLVKTTTKKASTKKEEVVKEVAKQQKPNIIEQVISNREVKYIYPDDVTDTLSRKKWRQQTRNELRKLEREMLRIQDHNSKEYKSAQNKYITLHLPTLCPFACACPAATAQSFRNLPFAGAGRPHQGQHRRSSDLLCLRSGCFHDLLHQRDKFRHGIYGQQPRHFGIPGLPHQHRILRLALQNIVDGIIQHNIKMDTILGTSQNNIFRWKLRELGHDLFCPHSHKMW